MGGAARASVVWMALCGAVAAGQSPAALPAPPAGPVQQASAGSLGDALLGNATALYGSMAKAGVRGFDCQVHPDWKRMMESSSKGEPVAGGEAKLALLSTVRITLHARLKGGASLDWQAPAAPERDQAAAAMLERAHRSMENTLEGVLKLWIPLVDGSVAEAFGAEDADVKQSGDGYTVRSKDKGQSLTEAFDKELVLKQSTAVDAGATVDVAPSFERSAEGLLPTGFVADVHPAGARAGAVQEMHVGIGYQTVPGGRIPGELSVEIPNVVQMEFKLDGCVVNPQ